MKNYIGAKIIKAEPMIDREFQNKFKNTDDPTAWEGLEGYHVQYPDFYDSWSPKDVFETAYRLITDSELDLIMGRPETEQGEELVEIDEDGNIKPVKPETRGESPE